MQLQQLYTNILINLADTRTQRGRDRKNMLTTEAVEFRVMNRNATASHRTQNLQFFRRVVREPFSQTERRMQPESSLFESTVFVAAEESKAFPNQC